MNKILVMIALCCLVMACSGVQKPPLSETQIVDGKSIVVPPEFDIKPESPKKEDVNPKKFEKSKKEVKKGTKKDKK